MVDGDEGEVVWELEGGGGGGCDDGISQCTVSARSLRSGGDNGPAARSKSNSQIPGLTLLTSSKPY